MLDMPFTIAEDVIAHYRNDGFVRLPGLLDAEELAHYGAEITRLTLALNTQVKPLEERETYDRAFLQVMNLWRSSEEARRFVFGKRLAGVAAQLLGVKAVRLYHDQSLYKEPSGGITPAHADQYYWPLATDRAVTAWIPLQTVPLEMGPLEFYAGSHRSEIGRDLPISDESEARITADMEAQGFPIDRAAYALGDVSFHGGWTFHRAGPNRSREPRSVMTMIYIDAEMTVAEPVNRMQQSDLAQWLPGLQPGDLAASPLNPLLL
ncbi:phytanoyl-CoA dioxygenase family protein [Novosphingobium sp. AAP93]|uniref:phytanoyl-CoA dioxygenase family protein n=1 Tax=Novosphingobium sp. AAP93 TaxID=1523427 RepID=UPI0006B94633|nr:phytanoyl-CoA dioxygenase family protein [Novosphingobium sp. AAP93]KPF80833.1 phytanoyl-CoA dioxygenase [Novosphingobium sp. AAP93]